MDNFYWYISSLLTISCVISIHLLGPSSEYFISDTVFSILKFLFIFEGYFSLLTFFCLCEHIFFYITEHSSISALRSLIIITSVSPQGWSPFSVFSHKNGPHFPSSLYIEKFYLDSVYCITETLYFVILLCWFFFFSIKCLTWLVSNCKLCLLDSVLNLSAFTFS